jgi:hypothetical protein
MWPRAMPNQSGVEAVRLSDVVDVPGSGEQRARPDDVGEHLNIRLVERLRVPPAHDRHEGSLFCGGVPRQLPHNGGSRHDPPPPEPATALSPRGHRRPRAKRVTGHPRVRSAGNDDHEQANAAPRLDQREVRGRVVCRRHQADRHRRMDGTRCRTARYATPDEGAFAHVLDGDASDVLAERANVSGSDRDCNLRAPVVASPRVLDPGLRASQKASTARIYAGLSRSGQASDVQVSCKGPEA